MVRSLHRVGLLALLAVSCCILPSNASQRQRKLEVALDRENTELFWDRILEDVASSIASQMPSPAPIAATPAPATGTPTVAPISITSSPTRAPVAAPSAPPAATPTEGPIATSTPTAVQTGVPTTSPTATPSQDPTLAGCFIDAEISCFDEMGSPCTNIVPPSGQCSVGATIESVTFTVLPNTCEDSSNSQADTQLTTRAS